MMNLKENWSRIGNHNQSQIMQEETELNLKIDQAIMVVVQIEEQEVCQTKECHLLDRTQVQVEWVVPQWEALQMVNHQWTEVPHQVVTH